MSERINPGNICHQIEKKKIKTESLVMAPHTEIWIM